MAGQILSKSQKKTVRNIIQGTGEAVRGAIVTAATVRAMRRQSLAGGVQPVQPALTPPQGLVKLPQAPPVAPLAPVQPVQSPLPPIQPNPQQQFPQQPLQPGQVPLQSSLQGPQSRQTPFQPANQQLGVGGVGNAPFNPQQNPVTLSQQLSPPPGVSAPVAPRSAVPPVSVPFQGGSGPDACSANDSSPQAVERCINAVRTNPNAFNGLFPCTVSGMVPRKALLTDNRLTNAAYNHAQDISKMGAVGHTGSDGSSVSTRVYRTGYPNGAVGENAAGGQHSAREVVFDWVCSQGHRENLMSCDYDTMGTGVVPTGGWTYWVQNFGCRSGRCTC